MHVHQLQRLTCWGLEAKQNQIRGTELNALSTKCLGQSAESPVVGHPSARLGRLFAPFPTPHPQRSLISDSKSVLSVPHSAHNAEKHFGVSRKSGAK